MDLNSWIDNKIVNNIKKQPFYYLILSGLGFNKWQRWKATVRKVEG